MKTEAEWLSVMLLLTLVKWGSFWSLSSAFFEFSPRTLYFAPLSIVTAGTYVFRIPSHSMLYVYEMCVLRAGHAHLQRGGGGLYGHPLVVLGPLQVIDGRRLLLARVPHHRVIEAALAHANGAAARRVMHRHLIRCSTDEYTIISEQYMAQGCARAL